MTNNNRMIVPVLGFKDDTLEIGFLVDGKVMVSQLDEKAYEIVKQQGWVEVEGPGETPKPEA